MVLVVLRFFIVSNIIWLLQSEAKKYNFKFGSYLLCFFDGKMIVSHYIFLIIVSGRQAACVVRRLSEVVKEKCILSTPAAEALQIKSCASILVTPQIVDLIIITMTIVY